MASGTATESVEQGDKVTLRVLVDKEKNKVLYAESGKDFVDALFSFLTLPLGTIARLVSKESDIDAVRFGSISSLYQSVSDLDEHLWSNNCKEMLLNPRNSMEVYCQQLKLNIDDTPVQVFLCEDWELCKGDISGSRISSFRNQKCICGKLLNSVTVMKTDLPPDFNGFVKETATFIIRDDLCVMPNDLGTSLRLLQTQGLNDIADVEKKTLVINKKEVVDLLKLSLLSKTTLTDFIFKNTKFLAKSKSTFQSEIRIGKDLPSDPGNHMVVKVLRRKSNRKILFATAVEDFADFLFSFLTFPLGGVLQMLEGLSSLSSIDVLYTSMTELSSDKCLRSKELKDELATPSIFPEFELKNQILPIGTSELTFRLEDNGKPVKLVDPKSSISGGYLRGPLTIMVTDDLVVTPMSSIDAVSYLERMKVPLNDVEEIVVCIGVKEGLSILKASLTSTSALTNGLNQYIDSPLYNLKKPKKEK